jgi:hypothetical protein
MTRCFVARDQLLEASPDELAGVAQTELADHVRACPRCGSMARILTEEHARLGAALSVVQPRLSADAAVDEVLGIDDFPVTMPSRLSRRERIRQFLVAALPMAAAAAIAAYFVYGTGSPAPPAISPVRPAAVVTVTAAPGTGTAVFATRNPRITLVWFGQEITP